MYIWDRDVLNKMAEVEVPDLGQAEGLTGEKLTDYRGRVKDARRAWKWNTMKPGEYTFFGALQHLARLQHEHIEVSTTSGLTPIEPPEGAVFVIYGVGGWHRWMVTFDGEVRFSRHHSTERATGLAETLGFRRW